jgi:hypothetical protein
MSVLSVLRSPIMAYGFRSTKPLAVATAGFALSLIFIRRKQG